MEKGNIQTHIEWFENILTAAFQLYFRQECTVTSIQEIPAPENPDWPSILNLPAEIIPSFEEKAILMLTLLPHLKPQALDLFFINNKTFDRPYTEFGGWKGISHGGFLPTGETAAFLLAGENTTKRNHIIQLFGKEHWFYRQNMLRLEGQGAGEPFLSGQLRASDELLSRILLHQEFKPDYSPNFPAKRLITSLEWQDLVVNYQVAEKIEEINTWILHHKTIMEEWGLNRFLTNGYRALFYGPPGTGKTLTATLIGKRNRMDVYRIDLSMIVSKYIGETEKNLARIFDQAENRNWILFFDEADALFGKRTVTSTSNDRYANQEIAYLLQRIEDFSGTVLLATNLRTNIDEAFYRRFQSEIYFPFPDEEERMQLWKNILPPSWLPATNPEIIRQISRYELSGGSIANVVRHCALQLLSRNQSYLSQEIILNAIQKELYKEGKV